MRELHFFVCFLLLISTKGSFAENQPYLSIQPVEPVQIKPVNKAVLLTCKPSGQKELFTDLKWTDPRGEIVKQDKQGQAVYTENLGSDGTLALIIRNLRESEAGEYTCSATYANSEKFVKKVRIETFVAITWEDAPVEQYPILHSDYKVKCKVHANPAPIVDWFKNGEALTTTDRYVIEANGLLIRKVAESDDGTFTCRAIVMETGEYQERLIKVEVHTPPSFDDMPTEAEVVEGDSGSITCRARGKPIPNYTWIKADTREELSNSLRFSTNPLTGVLTVNPAEKNDRGKYICKAKNAAGEVQRPVHLGVVVRPHIDELINISIAAGAQEAHLKCVVSGWPLPHVTFQRVGSNERFTNGAQDSDDRIVLEQEKLAPAVPGGEERAQGHLIISDLLRSDDGLYACIASNKGGEALKNGHITVEFPPSFAATPLKEAWSWDNHPVNISCLAESIPNATITWRLNEREIDRDGNIQQIGNGPESTLQIIPIDRRYYGVYKCRAKNIHGEAEHEILLREAHPPSEILQAKREVITATTITFSFIGPKDDGGLPTRAYAVQYREDRRNWNEALNKTWPVDSPYILEGLEPQKSYSLRFAARNDVGFGNWAADDHVTMPKRSSPEEPKIITSQVLDGVSMSPYLDRFELRWRIPPDNGEPIERYEIKYCEVRNSTDGWVSEGGCRDLELPANGPPTFHMTKLRPNTHYKVELRARNIIGYSTPGQVIFKTARDPTKTGPEPIVEAREPALSSGALIGVIVAGLFVVFVIVDISCFIFNKTGLTHLITSQCGSKQRMDEEMNRNAEKEPLKGPVVLINDDSLKKDTEVEYDAKVDGARIMVVPPRHSAV
ncbi:fasciclin-2 isoform X2 [Neocloeon triangulifer]|uniref:fasciclin-2 isoform X2 n=1 Tax=Neocloeon triangulifer TaxID=2078957 RepID=UPI00286EE740|nr:fasciclin-2 isoform X2 [Neocloeon triangulifer]